MWTFCLQLSAVSSQQRSALNPGADAPAASQAQAPLTSEGAKRPSESHRKRRPAPAAALGVRVVENEPFAHQARVVVERRPVDEPEALGIDEDPRSFRTFEHVVAVLR